MFNIGDQVAYLIDGVREHAEVITTSSLGHVFFCTIQRPNGEIVYNIDPDWLSDTDETDACLSELTLGKDY